MYTEADFHGPRKILGRKTPSWCTARMALLWLIVWMAVICLNAAIVIAFASAMCLPFWAFHIQKQYQHGPYGVLATLVLIYLLYNRKDRLHQIWVQQRDRIGLPRSFVLALSAVVPYAFTSLINGNIYSNSTKNLTFGGMIKDTLGGVWSLALFVVLLDVASNKIIPTWVAFHTILRDKKYLEGRQLLNRE